MLQKSSFAIPAALLLSVLIFCGTLLMPLAPQAKAQAYHAYVIGSDPVDGSTISRVPNEVHIFFNAPVSAISTAHIYEITSNGDKVDVNAAPSSVSSTNPNELITSVKNPGTLAEGSYEVIWAAVAQNDGYTTYGIIGFDVGYSSTGMVGNVILGPTSSNNLAEIHHLDFTALLSVLWDWLVLLALIFWIGIQVVDYLLQTDERSSGLLRQLRKRTLSIEWMCLWIMVLGEIITLILRITRYTQASLEQGLDVVDLFKFIPATLYGYIWLVRIILLIFALVLLYCREKVYKRQQEEEKQSQQDAASATGIEGMLPASTTTHKTRQPGETPDTTSVATSRAALSTFFLTGVITLLFVMTSSVTTALELHISAIVLGWVSLIAQGIWLGGLAYLAFILLPLLLSKESEYSAETLTNLLQRVTPYLLSSMGIQVFCMLFMSESSISDPQQFLNDPFGRTLLVQIVLLLLTTALSLYTFCIIRPHLTHQALLLPVVKANLPARQTRQTALSETTKKLKLGTSILAILGAGLLLCSALEVFYSPPIDFPNIKYSNAPSAQNGSINEQTRLIGDLNVTCQLQPGRTGYNHTIILTIADSKGRPVTNAQVKLTTNMVIMDMGTQSVTLQGGDPFYTATFDKRAAFNMPGLWNIDVQIQLPGNQKPLKGSFRISLTA